MTESDTDFARIAAAWPALPEAVRQAMVEAAEGLARGDLDLAEARRLLEAASGRPRQGHRAGPATDLRGLAARPAMSEADPAPVRDRPESR